MNSVPQLAADRGSSIRFDEVSLTYPGADRPAIDGVSLTIEPGSFIVFLGPSGCGKTTLLKMVNRLNEPTSGEIFVDGRSIHDFRVTTLRRQIGYVIQQVGLFPHMRVGDNIAVVPKLLGWDKRRVSERVDELLELVGLPPEEYWRRYPNQLSGGQQQRVGLARALAGDPRTILMDEPFGALDAITRTRLQDELLRIQRRLKRTILFVTHDIEEAVKLADKIAVLNLGRIEQYDTPLNIVLQPADAFVSELVGADDVLRKLSLMSVESVVRPVDQFLPIEELPRVADTSDLRSVLGVLLESERSTALVVEAPEGEPVGIVRLSDIQALSFRSDVTQDALMARETFRES